MVADQKIKQRVALLLKLVVYMRISPCLLEYVGGTSSEWVDDGLFIQL